MAGDEEWYGVFAIRIGDGSKCCGVSKVDSELFVGPGFSRRNGPQGLPHALLERCAEQVQTNRIKSLKVPLQILYQSLGCGHRRHVLLSPWGQMTPQMHIVLRLTVNPK